MWPGMKLVYGKPRQSQSQGSVERSSQDVQDMLVAWVSDNTKTWSEGLRFIQSKKNRALYSGIKTSPYEVRFGTAQRNGLGDSPLTEDMYSSIETEEELEELFNAGMNNGQDKEDKEEVNQWDRNDEDENQTNDTSEETLEKKDNKKVYCVICEESSGAHKCSVCNQFVHAICGSYSEDSEGFGLSVTCNLCVTTLSEKVQNLVRNNKLKKWFLSPTQDFHQLIMGQTL